MSKAHQVVLEGTIILLMAAGTSILCLFLRFGVLSRLQCDFIPKDEDDV